MSDCTNGSKCLVLHLYKCLFCPVVQLSIFRKSVVRMSGYASVKFSSVRLYNWPIVQRSCFQRSVVPVSIVHMSLYHCTTSYDRYIMSSFSGWELAQTIFKEWCAKSIQGQGQLITCDSICGMKLLIAAPDAFFWHNAHDFIFTCRATVFLFQFVSQWLWPFNTLI